jgi:pimeloyl-ACP methyl ester carboxylesterase
MRELVVRSGGVPLHVLDRGGDDTAVILLHGGGRDSRDWDDVAGRLQLLGYRVVAFDLRGHGGTPSAPWTWDLALEDVAAVGDALALRRPALVGHSLGGMVAALWATRHADCPLAVNIDGHGNPTRADQYLGMDQQRAQQAHRAMQAFLISLAGGVREEVREVMRAVDALDLFEVYRRARCPLVVISGQRSMAELLPAEVQEPWRAYTRWVRAQLAAAAAANPALEPVGMLTGHDAHLEAPEAVASLIHHRISTDATGVAG